MYGTIFVTNRPHLPSLSTMTNVPHVVASRSRARALQAEAAAAWARRVRGQALSLREHREGEGGDLAILR